MKHGLRQTERAIVGAVLIVALGVPAACGGNPAETQVLGIWHWSGPDHTRIVLDLTSAASFTHRVLPRPDRILVEIPHAVFAEGVEGIEVRDGVVDEIRTHVHPSGTAHVIVDVPRRPVYEIFSLNRPNRAPNRIVIDVTRSPADPGALENREDPPVRSKTDTATEEDPAAVTMARARWATRRVSLNLEGADLHEALKLLLASTDLNLVVGNGVQGTVTADLDHVPFEDALNVVLTVNGLSHFLQDNTLYVFRSEEADQLAPDLLRRDVITLRINYAPLGEVSQVVEKFLSPAGRVLVCPTTSTLVVEDVPETLRSIRRLVDSLDEPPRQVLIRAHIVDVTLDDETSLGIEWDYLRAADIVSEAVDMGATATLETEGFSPTQTSGLFFSFATSGFEALLDVLRERTATEVLACPTVLALDGREAEIIIGSKLGFRLLTTTQSGATMETVEFLDVGTQLTLTPHVGDDGLIILDVHPEVSNGVIDEGLPSETTTEATTSLIVEDGSTILIGGLMRNREEVVRSQVPFLGDIPILGRLFRKTNTTKAKSEVLVGITPYIVTPQGSDQMAGEIRRIDQIRDRARGENSTPEER